MPVINSNGSRPVVGIYYHKIIHYLSDKKTFSALLYKNTHAHRNFELSQDVRVSKVNS